MRVQGLELVGNKGTSDFRGFTSLATSFTGPGTRMMRQTSHENFYLVVTHKMVPEHGPEPLQTSCNILLHVYLLALGPEAEDSA